jgi:hypothetical protein
MTHLEMLTAREQLMEDIDCIVSAQYGQGNEELADEMIKLLCHTVHPAPGIGGSRAYND